MPTSGLWSDSQRQAWSYVKEGAESGLNATEALKEYRAGGGSIRNDSWYELYRDYKAGGERWDTVGYMQPGDHIPESMYVITDLNYQQKYIANVGVHYVDGNGVAGTQYITIESNERHTVSGITAAVADIMGHYETDEVESYGSISEMEFFEAAGWEE